ncbi:MAG: lipopolysaccharide biosynthesis protein, partial [Peptostreptococcaceae bacterium]
MSAYKKLIKNSGIFAIGTLGSKLISILLIPFYTYVLTTQEYGIIDMVTTSISLLIPIITLSIFDAALRFAVKSEYNKVDILTSSILLAIFGNILFMLSYPLILKIDIIRPYVNLFYLVLLFQSTNTVIAQFCRGIGKVK